MSAVFHWVRTTAPGVPFVPNPPGPSFQDESSNPGLTQSSAGLSSVKRQLTPSCCEVGTTSLITGGGGNLPASTAAARCGITLFTSRS